MPSPICLVVFRHPEPFCPLKQTGPEAAQALARRLRQVQAVGTFTMSEHEGALIARSDDPAALRRNVEELLNDLSVNLAHVVRVVTLPPELTTAAERYLDQPQLLEDAAEGYAFYRLADQAHPGEDLSQAERRRLDIRSLRSLPDFLEEHAPH